MLFHQFNSSCVSHLHVVNDIENVDGAVYCDCPYPRVMAVKNAWNRIASDANHASIKGGNKSGMNVTPGNETEWISPAKAE